LISSGAPGEPPPKAVDLPIELIIDDYDVEAFGEVAASFDGERLGYVVTPNVDHIIRYHDDSRFRSIYSDAAYVLLDSRFLARCLAVLRGQKLRVCPGSDLTAYLLSRASKPTDRIVLVGASGEQARRLVAQYNLDNLVHIDPPMGFIRNPEEVERCLRLIEEASPFRYCFLAVGSPQQELIAWQLQQRQRARGLMLCIGGSINFLTGIERRAPKWIQQLGGEWMFRLLQSPTRMATRYLVRGPRFFLLLRRLRIVASSPAKLRRGADVGVRST